MLFFLKWAKGLNFVMRWKEILKCAVAIVHLYLIAAKVRKYELLLCVKEIKQGYKIYCMD
jgi:hypothetical protein